jgi:hypothetical protein
MMKAVASVFVFVPAVSRHSILEPHTCEPDKRNPYTIDQSSGCCIYPSYWFRKDTWLSLDRSPFACLLLWTLPHSVLRTFSRSYLSTLWAKFLKAFTSIEGKRRDFKWKHVPIGRTRRKFARVKQHSLRLPMWQTYYYTRGGFFVNFFSILRLCILTS